MLCCVGPTTYIFPVEGFDEPVEIDVEADSEEEEDLDSGMATIFVTQTDEPLLLTSGKGPGAETIVYDAASGEELRRIGEVAGRFYAP